MDIIDAVKDFGFPIVSALDCYMSSIMFGKR